VTQAKRSKNKDLREHARKSIETSSGKKSDPKVFNRLAKRLAHVQGDFAETDTYQRLAAHIKRCPQDGRSTQSRFKDGGRFQGCGVSSTRSCR
jgi:glucose-6-phosphate 1-dehydrogenase